MNLDISSYAMAVLKRPLTECFKPYFPQAWFDPELAHTHKPLDDAMEQVMLVCNMVQANVEAKD